MPLVLAHLGGPQLAPLQLAPLTITGILYALRVRRLDGTPRAVPGTRQAAFYAGLALILLSLASPLGHVADELFAAHMVEHLLIGDIAALLIVVGLTGPVLAPVLRIRPFGALRVLAHPGIALPLWALDFYLWHVPALHEAAVRHAGVHALQHTAFIAFGVNMWMALLGPLPKPAWFSNAWQVAYVLAVRLIGAVLGNVFLFGGAHFYDVYARGEAHWHISANADQVAAGAIMGIEGSFLTVGIFCWVFLRTARQNEERQALMDLAAAQGVELTDARAERAVRAGRGAELRRRITEG